MEHDITAAITQYNYVIIAALGVAVTAIIVTIMVTLRRSRTGDRDILSGAVTLMVLALTAEGMYWVLTTKLAMPLPWWLAVFVCAVAEGLMVNFFRLARRFQQRHGRPGPFGTAFWIVAVCEGAIVALASNNIVEIALRILLPLGVALLHWIKLTAEDSRENRGRFVWTPLNLLIRLGAWKPGDTTVSEAEIQRHEDKLTRAAYMLASARFLRERRLRRVRRMTLKASPETADRVVERLRLAYGIEARIAEATRAGGEAVRAAAGIPGPTSVAATATSVVLPGNNDGSQSQPAIEGIPMRVKATAERDADIVVRYWDALIELVQNGSLCRSSIERACTVGTDKVLARQANRILDIVTCANTLDQELPVAARVAKAISMISAGRS